MIRLVGKEGVDVYKTLVKNHRVSKSIVNSNDPDEGWIVQFLQSTGVGKFLLDRMTYTNSYRQGMASDDPELVEARKLKEH